MSLSKEPAFSTLRNRFVCGYKNIRNEAWAGNSGVHPINGAAVATTNGAGPHNLQLFVMDPDGTVLHCLPGFWDSSDLVKELDLAEKLHVVWQDKSIAPEQKRALYEKMQLEHIGTHSHATVERSHMQGFDMYHVFQNQAQLKDAIEDPAALKGADIHSLPHDAFKTTDKLMHERLARVGFKPYQQFDVAAFTNYGTTHYDKYEHEMEGSPKLSLKSNDLRAVTYDTDVKAAGKVRSLSEKKFYQFARIGNWNRAFQWADQIVKEQPNKPTGYELRSIAAFRMGKYQNADADSARAQWLGSRHPAMAQVRKMCQPMLRRSG